MKGLLDVLFSDLDVALAILEGYSVVYAFLRVFSSFILLVRIVSFDFEAPPLPRAEWR